MIEFESECCMCNGPRAPGVFFFAITFLFGVLDAPPRDQRQLNNQKNPKKRKRGQSPQRRDLPESSIVSSIDYASRGAGATKKKKESTAEGEC